MAAQVINGALIAEQVQQEVACEVQLLRQQGVVPGLAAVLVGNNPASEVYVRNKVRACEKLGIFSEKIDLPETVSERDLLVLVHDLNQLGDIDGILVQLPLPDAVDAKRILSAVDPAKDVDGLHPVSVGRLCGNQPGLRPCTPLGVMEMLKRSGVTLPGAEAVVLGRSDMVGKPQAFLLLHSHATVTLCHSRTRNLPEVTRRADVLVVAIGRPAMVTAEYVKPGAVVIDVGISKLTDRDQVRGIFGEGSSKLAEFDRRGYALVGDVHAPSVSEVAGMLSPVPGGVGPLTIAMLMSNTVRAARMRRASGQ